MLFGLQVAWHDIINIAFIVTDAGIESLDPESKFHTRRQCFKNVVYKRKIVFAVVLQARPRDFLILLQRWGRQRCGVGRREIVLSVKSTHRIAKIDVCIEKLWSYHMWGMTKFRL